jgi:hypothetical protein
LLERGIGVHKQQFTFKIRMEGYQEEREASWPPSSLLLAAIVLEKT